jgi:uncharacterized protein (TIGR02117 family)
MKLIKKTLKYFLISMAFIVWFVTFYMLLAFVCKYIPINNDYEEPIDGTEIFIISNGVHADICLPLKDNGKFWSDLFNFEEFSTLRRTPKYISFGWGDKGFFLDTPTWNDLTLSTALNAAFLPSNTAIHVSYLEDKPSQSENTKSFKVNNEALKRIENYIVSYIQLNNDKPQLIDCCRYPNVHDNFYEANGSYHMFRTCNVWTNQVIKEGGVRTSVWTPFDWTILYQFEKE